ncbi:DUF6089 family protein [Nafulsella turpanensis]|uniref:DUF6089 family protein n=1 Tax=Nafulsella turpanensis TaxID=1265690 RepID=UPI00034ADF18|nr:DUF6089 family protein [Nafulsella turpanensis]
MKKLLLLFSLFMVGILISSDVLGQRISQFRGRRMPFAKNKRYLSVGFTVNAFNYFGDLTPQSHFASTSVSYTRPGVGVTGMYRMGPRSFMRGNFMWGRLQADDFKADPFGEDSKYRYVRNLHFRNDIKELSLEYVFDFIPHHRTFITRPQLIPFVSVGLAIFHHNPKAKVPSVDAYHYNIGNAQPIEENDLRYGGVSPGDWIALKPLGTEGQYIENSGVEPYSNWQFAIPLGAGVRYRLNRFVDISFELSYHQTFTDYLDDVSGLYVNPEEFGDTPEANLARLMADRSKEPFAALSGEERDLNYIREHINGTHLYGQVPPDFGDLPYELISGYGSRGTEEFPNIRGKDDWDVYLVTKFQLTYIIGTNIRNAKFR